MQVKAQLAAWLRPRGLSFNEDKTRVVDLDDGFRLPRVQRPPLQRQAADQTEQGGDQTDPGTAPHRGAGSARSQRLARCSARSTRSCEAGRPTTGRWCPARRSARWTTTCGNSPTSGPDPWPPEQVEALGRRPVLRPVQPVQAGPVGVRRPRQRRLPHQVRLDQDRPTPDGRGHIIARRSRPDRLLGRRGDAHQPCRSAPPNCVSSRRNTDGARSARTCCSLPTHQPQSPQRVGTVVASHPQSDRETGDRHDAGQRPIGRHPSHPHPLSPPARPTVTTSPAAPDAGRPRSLLEPGAVKAARLGSEGAPAQQCAGATRQRRPPGQGGQRTRSEWTGMPGGRR